MSLPAPAAHSARRRAVALTLAATTLTLISACTSSHSGAGGRQTSAGAVPSPQPAQLFEGLGAHTRKVSTQNPEAQRYFDQALIWTFSFNHDEAIRSFERAAELDPGLAIAYWGIALCNGPHINNPVMDEPRARAAWDALQRARSAAAAPGSPATPRERALIAALSARYTDPSNPPVAMTFEERAPLDRAYAEAMASVYARFPDDADIATLYAESLMDCRPWDLWDPVTKAPRPETPSILAALEHALALDPNHPGANHYYIHAVEASTSPERAVAAADRLRDPDTGVRASGHMVHMPAHIDVRVGRWPQAAEQNRRAIRTDAAYRVLSPTQGLYRIYMAHNDHFLAWSCMMLGRRAEALQAARRMIDGIPESFARDAAPFVDPMMLVEMEAMMRFGLWDDILKVPEPRGYHPITAAYRRFARASAYAAQNRIDDAVREQRLFRDAVKGVPEKAMMALNPAHRVLDIADHTLAGEIAYRRWLAGRAAGGEHAGDPRLLNTAVAELTAAVEIEDSLLYMEPPDWFQPVRHTLGAVLLDAGRDADAAQVYRADLQRWPENGWALYGLALAMEQQGDPEAAAVRGRFEKAWADADTPIHATCLCVPMASKP